AQTTEIAAHRGANHLAPENTKAAAQAAIDLGVEYIEIDVRKSRDGVHFIIHDLRVNRTTDGSGFVSEMTASQLRKLDAGSWYENGDFAGEPIPELYDYLKWIKGEAKVYFDVKSADWDTLYAYVKEFEIQDEAFFNFFSKRKARKFKEQFPDLHIKVNSYSSDPEDLRKTIKKYNASVIEIRPEHMNGDLKKVAEEENVRLMVYAKENSEKEFRQIIKFAPAIVNLDRPALFVKLRTLATNKK
ncbi:MAG: glycerophosphodiester phosphodiesterase family protein, partial [Chitinophagales bacterium]